MELTARERDVTMMALMLYATSDVPKRAVSDVVGMETRLVELADRAVARDAYYKLLCSQAGVR